MLKRERSESADQLVTGKNLVRKRQLVESVGDSKTIEMSLLSPVACGRAFCVAIAEDGRVFSWGKSAGGEGATSDEKFPKEVEQLMPHRIVGVACGNFHSLAISEQGDVFAWGSNARGRLGTGNIRISQASKENVPICVPRNMFRGRAVVSVGCGLHHSVFLLEDGCVFSAGCNENGQLGRATGFRSAHGVSPEPQHVALPDSVFICRIASGRHHVLALSREGHLFGWGKNDVGQLGLTHNEDTPIPVRVGGSLFHSVRMFDCGRNHSVVALTDDTLWSFGQNVDGQLGHQDRLDRLTPDQIERFRGIPLKQISCGSRQTSVLTMKGTVHSWGWLLEKREVAEFSVQMPIDYSSQFQLTPGKTVASLHAGSTHMVVVFSDRTIAIVGENPDQALCQGPKRHPDKAFPPVLVTYVDGSLFKLAKSSEETTPHQTPLAAHLMSIWRQQLYTDVVLTNASGDQYHLHRAVLASRCPKLIDVPIPVSSRACKQLFDWIYGQRCDLLDLSALELVQIIQTVSRCSPHLGQLATLAERTFLMLISSDKEETLLAAEQQDVMASPLSEWVKSCLSDHLKTESLETSDVGRVPSAIFSEAAILSHSKTRKRPVVTPRDEVPIDKCFTSMLESGMLSDFQILFNSGEEPLSVHTCIISRMAFFEAFLRNSAPERRTFTSFTPRSAMKALLMHIYGGELQFSPWDALYLMSPENGVSFYFAGDASTNSEIEVINLAMQSALGKMPIRDSINAYLCAKDLAIPQAEAVLIDLIAAHYREVEDLLEDIVDNRGGLEVLQIQRQVIYSLQKRLNQKLPKRIDLDALNVTKYDVLDLCDDD